MVNRPCRGRVELFLSTQIKNKLKKYSINNNDIVPFLHVLTGNQINMNNIKTTSDARLVCLVFAG